MGFPNGNFLLQGWPLIRLFRGCWLFSTLICLCLNSFPRSFIFVLELAYEFIEQTFICHSLIINTKRRISCSDPFSLENFVKELIETDLMLDEILQILFRRWILDVDKFCLILSDDGIGDLNLFIEIFRNAQLSVKHATLCLLLAIASWYTRHLGSSLSWWWKLCGSNCLSVLFYSIFVFPNQKVLKDALLLLTIL